MKKMLHWFFGFSLVSIFLLVPVQIKNFSTVHVFAEDEEYVIDVSNDITWGDEHALVSDEVYVHNGAVLTLEEGVYNFKNFIDVIGDDSKIIFNGGNYVFENSVTVYDNAEVILRKGEYIFEGNFSFSNGAKLTIEKGVHIKFKKVFDYTPFLQINGGVVFAIGEENERISFEGADDVSNDYGIYIGGFSDDDVSKFDYVDFIGGGKSWEETPQASIFDMFIKTAHAETMLNGFSTVAVDGGMVQISNSKFSKGNYYPVSNTVYIDSYGEFNHSFLKISDTDFIDNEKHFAVNSKMNCTDNANSCYTRVILENNWYGSADGPRTDENPDRSGDVVSGPAIVNGWRSEMHFPEIDPSAASNVLFLPGLKASRLYGNQPSTCPLDGDNNKLTWEPNCNDDVRWLYLDEDGKSINTINTKRGDIIDETPSGSNVYKSFIEKMDEMKNTDKTINDWKPIAYDWRLSLDDILEDGSIENAINELAASSKTKKVTIVAHSNGGLLAKALMQKLGNDEAKRLIDKIIFVAVPQVGTPAAVAALLHGEDQDFFPVLNEKTARGFGENMPGAYNLIPSEKYFSTVQTPVVEFKTEQSDDWRDLFDTKINSKSGLHKFLADDFRRVSATDSDVNTPAKLNQGLLENAEETHENLDAWTLPDGVKLIQIAGWGVPDTLRSTEYDTQNKTVCDGFVCQFGVEYLDPDFIFTIDGDGTVVSPSALWMNGAEKYWFNIMKYNKNNKLATVLGFFGPKHGNILENEELLTFIKNIIVNRTNQIPSYEYFSTDVPPASDGNRLQYSLHSPLTLELVDDEGRRTGINSDGQIQEQIPGTYFKQFGDVKYIFADEDISSHVEMNGYDSGTFTFAVKELKGDEKIDKIVFKDMPTTAQTKVTFAVPSDLESASNLEIDKDGDETIDFSFEPKIGEVVTFDLEPPTTEISISGTLGANDWHTGNIILDFSVTDNEGGSGVFETNFSLDEGKTWSKFVEPFSISDEGIKTVRFFSLDKNGNREDEKNQTIKIDKTAPEMKVTFNAGNQKLELIGKDNLSDDVLIELREFEIFESGLIKENKNSFWNFSWLKKQEKTKMMTTATALDQAGHKTELVWEKKKSKDRRIDLSFVSISYDGQKKAISSGNLQYKWLQDWRKTRFFMFASHLDTNLMSLESHYMPKQNQTWIMEKPGELADNDGDDGAWQRPVRKKMPGMIIPSIITEKGIIKINY